MDIYRVKGSLLRLCLVLNKRYAYLGRDKRYIVMRFLLFWGKNPTIESSCSYPKV